MKHLVGIVGVSALVLTGEAVAAESVAPECKLSDSSPKLVAKIREMPNYFSKVTPDGKYMCYIADGNIIMDLENPDTRVIVPGPYDPVPTPPVGSDHKSMHMTVPLRGNTRGMAFFKMEDIENAMRPGESVNMAERTRSVYLDTDNTASYQSVGVLPGTQDHPIYRMLNGSLSINDYDTSTTPWTRVRHNEDTCGESGRYQLPMLSKDGKELSVYDTRTSTTKIMGVNDDGTCVEKLDLGYPTGKVEFSYDGKAIAFHVDSFSTANQGEQFSGVSSNMTKNIYVLNLVRNGTSLKAGAIKRLTNNRLPGQGSYYPSFTYSGDIVYVNGETDSSGHGNYSFVKVDPKNVPEMDFTPTQSECVDRTTAQFALGSLWTQVCSRYANQISGTDAALWTLSLDPKACVRLVRENWSRMKDSVLSDEKITRSGIISQTALNGLTAAALEKVCPTEKTKKEDRILQVAASRSMNISRGPQTAQQIYTTRCQSCHDGTQGRVYHYDHLSLDDINNMLIEIESGDMPRERVENREAVLKPLVDDLLAKRVRAEQELPK